MILAYIADACREQQLVGAGSQQQQHTTISHHDNDFQRDKADGFIEVFKDG